MRYWEAAQPSFRFIPVLSEEPADSPWTGDRGLVSDAVARLLGDVFGAEAYVAGPPPMIDATVARLEDAGLLPEDIHCDRFVAAR